VNELVVLLGVVIALMAVTTLIFTPARWLLRRVELVMLTGSVLVILFVMGFVCAEVMMRYIFNSPIPGHLEGSELLMPIIVFLAISYTQRVRGHVGMDLLIEALSPNARRVATCVTLLVSSFVCAILAYFSYKSAYQLWEYDDVTMTPPYFKTWPAGASIAIGYALLSARMFLQVLSEIDPDRFPDDIDESERELHQTE